MFRERTGADVRILAHNQAAAPCAGDFADRRDFLLVGRLDGERTVSPNVDSIHWFVEEVMPRLDALLGDGYRLIVAGVVLSSGVEKLASDRVVLKGPVKDLTELYSSARVFLAPTRFSAGVPIKVQEAAGRGIPCVVTSPIAVQSGLAPERELLAADDPEAFARQCARLYQDAELWRALRAAALERVTVLASPQGFREEVAHLLLAASEPAKHA